MTRALLLALRLGVAIVTICVGIQAAHATVSTFLSAGDTCLGGSSVQFSETGGTFKVTLCATTTVEGVCGASIYPRIGAAAENGHFKIIARTLGTAIPDASSAVAFPLTLNATPDYLQNLGGSRTSPTSPAASTNQILATFEIAPQTSATNVSYSFSLDGASEINHALAGTNCFTAFNVDPMAPSITLLRGTAPQVTSATSATFTVGFAGSYQVTATGTPTPGLTIGGAILPANVSFVPATGTLSGTPQLGTVGTYNITFTAANGNLPDFTQNFTLNVIKANQAINFGALADRPFSMSTINVSATANSGLSVAFTTSTPDNCTVSGNVVTMLATGTCSLVASQIGNANFNPALPISQSFQITGMGPYVVTPSTGSNGSISPNTVVAVAIGATTNFVISPNAGFVASVAGTCGGTLVGNTYTTAAINGPCTVIASFFPLITYAVVLEGAQETPPNAATGTGSGTAVVDTVNNKITLNLTFSGMTGTLNGSHLHGPAVRGLPAGVKVSIGGVSPITDTVTYSEMDEADILAGRWYVNLHTAANGGGEIRGQLDNLGAANKALTVAVAGTGSGSVTGTGISCPGDCAETVPHNTVIALTATSNMGSTFTGWSGACSGTGACNVTMNFLKAVTATFAQNTYTVTPSVVGMGSISPSMAQTVNQGANLMFTVTPAMGFNANVTGTCGGNLAGATFTTNPISANCTVIVTFSAPLALVRVESRKVHGAFTCNVLVDRIEPIGGNVTTEPRDNGNGHLVVFVFDDLVTGFSGVSVTPVGTPSPSTNGNELLVTLTGIPDNSRVTVTVNGVNGAVSESASVGFLAGDVSNSRGINAADISAAKAQQNQTVSLANCRADINADGQIKPADVSAVKSRSGRALQ